mmetsp:Transcript_28450/g.90646  ORF Transcript_28450/g.90646 Transcript_28450/m.90646 type:complete len:82 (+) Transcript_28450:164-409(+)
MDLRFPGLVYCDPLETLGCMQRCHRGVDAQSTPPLRMCSMLRCLSGCTQLASRRCPDAGARACRMVKSTMESRDFFCPVDC